MVGGGDDRFELDDEGIEQDEPPDDDSLHHVHFQTVLQVIIQHTH